MREKRRSQLVSAGESPRYEGRPPKIHPVRFLADGETVVVLSEVSIGGETGHSAEVYTIRNGKTVRVQVYGDTAMMERQHGKKAVVAG